MTRKSSRGYTKAVEEATYEGETRVDEGVGKFIKRRKSYNISFQIGIIISHKEIR